MFNLYSRNECLRQATEETWDLLVVGGGITGAGVARDAASRGLKVLLLEARDFASGTSSRSSKLIHGGIRYLENLEFGLVHEALTERKILLEIAPHMVHPLRFLIPIYKSSRVGLFKMELGMLLYDLLSVFEAPQLHQPHRSGSTLLEEPHLQGQDLKGSVVYSDAYMEDDRLVIETLRSAHEMGVQCANYTAVTALQKKADGCVVEAVDHFTGKKLQIQAQQVVGCVGPWTDVFGHEVLKEWQTSLRPTKGVHVIFPWEKLPVSQAIVMAVEARIIFVIPRDEVVIVGTTDTDFKDDPTEVLASSADVEYLLGAANRYFPSLKLEKSDIISCYSGVRPLVGDGAKTESKTSREHHIFKYSDRVTLVAGGKYTTYRAMGEEIVDTVLKNLKFEERMKFGPSRTKVPLNPMATPARLERVMLQASSLAEEFQLPLSLVKYVLGRHAEEGLQILRTLQLIPRDNILESLWLAEAKFSIENEMCLSLVDFYWRRSPLFLFHRDNGLRFLDALASLFAKMLNWSEKEAQEQKEKVLAQAHREKQSLQ